MSIRRIRPRPERTEVVTNDPSDLTKRRLCEYWADAEMSDGSRMVLLQAKSRMKATAERLKNQIIAAEAGPDGALKTRYVFFVGHGAAAPEDDGELLLRISPPTDPVEGILREAHEAAVAEVARPITVDLDERASAVMVQSLAEAVQRVTRAAQAAEAAGQLEGADHHFEEAQNLRAHLDALRDARAGRGWSPDGDEAPEGTGDLD